jgi:hypothetical protein
MAITDIPYRQDEIDLFDSPREKKMRKKTMIRLPTFALPSIYDMRRSGEEDVGIRASTMR